MPLSEPMRQRMQVGRLILAAYAGLILAGSLYPVIGWHAIEQGLFDFVQAPLPKYITRNDITTNLLLYLPAGYLLQQVLVAPKRHVLSVLLAILTGALFSLGMETLQQFVPGRIASNLDVYINACGAFLGALLALHHGRWLRAWKAFRRWRERWFQPHGLATPGLWLLLLWMFTQFSLLPFPGVGWLDLHLRPIDMPPLKISEINLVWFLTVFVEMTAVGAFASTLLRPGRYVSAMVFLLLGGFVLKLLAASVLLRLKVMVGVLSLETLAAILSALWFLLLPAVSRHRVRVAVLFLMAILAGRLLFLPSPFWHSGSMLNLIGLAAHAAALWPLLALLQMGWAAWWRVSR